MKIINVSTYAETYVSILTVSYHWLVTFISVSSFTVSASSFTVSASCLASVDDRYSIALILEFINLSESFSIAKTFLPHSSPAISVVPEENETNNQLTMKMFVF